MKTSSQSKAGHFSFRGGRRKCQRCKVVFDKPSGEKQAICPRCKTHCSRCDVELTAENWLGKGAKGNRFNYRCKQCNAETARITVDKEKQRDRELGKKFGITLNEYNKLLEAQNGVCWICKRPPATKALSVDHKHVLNDKKQNPRDTRTRVRGLLCWHCNNAIAKFDDKPEMLRAAASYLEKWPAQEILNAVLSLPE